MITPRYLALLTIFIGLPLLDRFKREIGALVRLGGIITILEMGATLAIFQLLEKIHLVIMH